MFEQHCISVEFWISV